MRKKELPESRLSYVNDDNIYKPVTEGDSCDAKVEKSLFVAPASQYGGNHVRDAGSDSHFYDAILWLINDSHRIEGCI